jgi:filamentous hemagglutinin family protein
VACLQAGLILFFNFAPLVHANPTGENVVAGSATFDRAGKNLTIRTSDRVIINWQDFSIGGGELTKFVQPSAMSAALNRVVSGNPSSILGTLQANGKIFLINPNGILVGNGATIDTGGFIASTLDVDNQQFLNGGNLTFTGNSKASVVNQGKINAIGGDVYLIARHVENQGELIARDGTVGLAAGTEVLLAQTGDEKIFVKPTQSPDAPDGSGIVNSGTIQAAQAELKAHGNLYALAINNTGVVRANGAVTKNGRVYLTASGGHVANSGTLVAKNQNGAGGKIVVTGKQVSLTEQAVVDASGGAGGEIYIGGNKQGQGPLENAESVWIGNDVTISANGVGSGTGGSVIVFASDAAYVGGHLSALGGGFVETSGKEGLAVLNAPTVGEGGTWLIDPRNLRLTAGAGISGITVSGSLAAPVATSTADDATLGVVLVNIALGLGANVTIQTGGTGLQAGDLTMDPGVDIQKTFGGAATLTMNAHNNLSVNGISSSNDTLTITLNADSDGSGAGSVTLNGAIVSNGGNFAANGVGVTVAATGSVNAGAGTVTLNGGTGAIALGGSLTGSLVSLNGAGVNQTAGVITAPSLRITGGAGIFNVQQVGNDITTLAASVGGGFTYRDANSFAVGTVGAVSGVQTTANTLSLLAPGTITISDTPVAGADVQGPSTVDIIANNIVINGTISSGTTATLRQFTPGQLIDLGGADAVGTLGLTAAEIDRVTAGILRIGNVTSGNITVTAPIAPAGTSRLTLRTGGAVIDGNAVGNDITEANLAIISSTGIGSANALETAVTFLAFNNSVSGNVNIDNSGVLTITSLDGVTTSSNAGGTTTITTASPLIFGVNTTSAGTLTAIAGDSVGAGDILRLNAGVTVRSTGGDTILRAGDDVILRAGSLAQSDVGDVALDAGFSDVDGLGAIQLIGSVLAGGDALLNAGFGGATQTGGSIIADGLRLTGAGTFNLTSAANDVNTVAGSINGSVQLTDLDDLQVGSVGGTDGLQVSGSAALVAGSIGVSDTPVAGADLQADTIDLQADNLSLVGTLAGTTVTLHSLTAGQLVDLGGADAAGTLGLTNTELNNITATTLVIGDALGGDITITSSIAPAGVGTVSRVTGGAVVDANAVGNDLSVTSLAIFAATGIGSADPLETAVSNLAFVNTTSGDVQIFNTGALTIASVGGITSSLNLGGSTTLSAASPLTFAVDTTSVGSLTASAGESPALGDDLTVNAGVTLRSIAGDVLLIAGDNVLTGLGSTVLSDTGDLTLIAGNDLTNNGTLQSTLGDITLVVDDDFPVAPDFGDGILTNNGLLVRGGRLLVFAVQPNQVFPSADALVPESQWVYSTYFGDAIPALGDVMAFKIPEPSDGDGGIGGLVSALLAQFTEDEDRYYRPPNVPPTGPYGIYYDSSSLDAAPPNLESDDSLDPAPPAGLPAPSGTVIKRNRNLTGDSSFAAFAAETPPVLP